MSDTPARSLALYHSQSCGFCWMVQRAIGELGVEVELRDVDRDAVHREALFQARGRGTVPVLRIVEGEGEGEGARDEWMPESRDIVTWLRREYG